MFNHIAIWFLKRFSEYKNIEIVDLNYVWFTLYSATSAAGIKASNIAIISFDSDKHAGMLFRVPFVSVIGINKSIINDPKEMKRVIGHEVEHLRKKHGVRCFIGRSLQIIGGIILNELENEANDKG